MPPSLCSIIANPVAGKGRARKIAPELVSRLEASGKTAALSWTTSGQHAESLAREASSQGAERIIVCGGDGTIHHVVNGLMAARGPDGGATLGVVPVGRCNDLASSLGIPSNPAKAVETVSRGTARRIDLGRIGHRYFVTVATLGFDTEVSRYVAEGKPPFFLRGMPAYIYGTLVQLARYRDVEVHLRGDFGEFEGPIFLAATSNTPTYGGRLKIAPSAVLDDGRLDLCLVKSASRWDVVRMIPRVFSGSHVKHPAVSIQPLRRLEIDSSQPLWVWADGEPVAETPATIEVVPSSLAVLVP